MDKFYCQHDPLRPPVLKPGEITIGVGRGVPYVERAAPSELLSDLLADLDIIALTNKVIAILSPVHNGAESIAATVRKVIDAVVNAKVSVRR